MFHGNAMKTRLITTADPKTWHAILDRMVSIDIYFLPEYHYIHELNGEGKALAFVAEENGHIFFSPFMLRLISQEDSVLRGESSLYDIETVYGYSGPLCSTSDTKFIAKALSDFHIWCQQQNIVAEFIRFNPLLDNHRYIDPATYKLEKNRQTVALHLDIDRKKLWADYTSTHRNMIRKAQKNHLTCEEIELNSGIATFKHLYDQAMERIEADDYYFFSDDYFNALIKKLGEHTRLFVVRKGEKAVAGALFFFYNQKIHYHLAGSDPEFRKMAPNNLLLSTVAEYGRDRGFAWFHLGGGGTPDPQDSLFRFKTSISKQRLSFYIGKRIHMKKEYESLCNNWLRKNNSITRPDYFLLYRKKDC